MERATTHSPRHAHPHAGARSSRNASRSATTPDHDHATPPPPTTAADYYLAAAHRLPSTSRSRSRGAASPLLRSVGSRASLGEQFATTRQEYDFGFDDAGSLAPAGEFEDDDDDDDGALEDGCEELDGRGDETLTWSGSLEDSLVLVAPVAEAADADADARRVQRVPRTHYELLCLPDGDAATGRDVRSAYYRLYDTLRSPAVPARYRQAAEAYFSDVQAAFETLMGCASRQDSACAVLEEEDDSGSDSGHLEDVHGGRRTNPRFVERRRRQQEQGTVELGVQVDAQPLFSPQRTPLQQRQILPSGLCLTQTCATSFPAASRILQPRARWLYHALQPPPVPGDEGEEGLEIYCPAPTVTVSAAVFATSTRAAWLPPAASLSEQHNIIPDVFSRDRPLTWYAAHLSPLLNLQLRQELFHRRPGLSDAALRRTLPDAVVELETETLNSLALTARASRNVSLGVHHDDDDDDDDGAEEDPLHVEASVSVVSQSWLARCYATRLGFAVLKAVSGTGGTLFACLDSGTSALWDHRPSPWAFRDGQDGMGASWRSHMDSITSLLGQGLVPYYSSPPTAEFGYKFSDAPDETMAMPTGRPLTKQARGGLRRLHDDATLVGPGNGGSWTVSGAVTTSSVAGCLRYGRDILFRSTPTSPPSLAPTARPHQPRGREQHVCGFLRLEAEVTAQKSTRSNPLFPGGGGGAAHQWRRAEIAHLAVRGLTPILGTAYAVGLELGVSSASNGAVVLSLAVSRRRSTAQRLFVLPVLLVRDSPLLLGARAASSSGALFWAAAAAAALLPALLVGGFAAYDSHVAFRRRRSTAETAGRPQRRRRRGGEEEEREREREREKKAGRARGERRAEAEALVAMLAQPVAHRQRLQRERGGLVILSAKLGVLLRDHPPGAASSPSGGPQWWAEPEDGVADVTTAVAALVDGDGRLWIPAGLRKSRLLGFWDPTPGRTKWLVVRYLYRGREATRAVAGRAEMKLP